MSVQAAAAGSHVMHGSALDTALTSATSAAEWRRQGKVKREGQAQAAAGRGGGGMR